MNVFVDILNKKTPSKETKKEIGVPDDVQNNIPNVLEKSVELDCFDSEAKDDRGILLRHLDPRPDLEKDHEEWKAILNNAMLLDELTDKLFGTLHFLRASGAGIKQTDSNMGFMLVQGSWDKAATGMSWDQAKKAYLVPLREDLVKLFSFTKENGMLPDPEELFKKEKLVFGVTDPKKFRKK